MMKRLFLAAVVLVVVAGCQAERNEPRGISAADLVYTKPVGRIEEGLPIGNGRMGTLVWTTADALHMAVNRVDVFGIDNASVSFPERHTDYCGGCGFVDLDVGGNVFSGSSFGQVLTVEDGLAVTRGSGVTVKALAWNERDVIALEVDDERFFPQPISVGLRMLRPPVEKRFEHKAISQLGRGEPAPSGEQGLILVQTFEERDYLCRSALSARVSGRSSALVIKGEREMDLVTEARRGKFVVLIGSAASMKADEDVMMASELERDAGAEIGFDAMLRSNEKWWGDFWGKSYVRMHSSDGLADQVGGNFNYFLYLMGSTSRGKYPTKFNGMLWSNGGDKRQWGSMFWGANQSCLYNNVLFATNHAELMQPMFDMYSGMLKSCEVAAEQEWGSAGAFIPETVAFNGLAELPADIAEEMRGLYLMQKPWDSISERFWNYAGERLAYSSRWNWVGGGKWVDGKWEITERSESPYGPVTHIFSRGAKIAYQYWTQYEYTGDEQWLRERAYPVIKDVAEFYRNFPNLKKGSDGVYHIYHVNSNEGVWDATDTDEEIASMRAMFAVGIEASEKLGVDAELAGKWREVLEHLAPLPTRMVPATWFTKAHEVWVRGASSAAADRERANAKGGPDGNTMPEWFFDEADLETTGRDGVLANATLDEMMRPDRGGGGRRRGAGGTNRGNRRGAAGATSRPVTSQPATQPVAATRPVDPTRGRVGVLSKVPLAAAMLGRADIVKRMVPEQSLKADVAILANRMDVHEGVQTTTCQRLGNAADAVQAALCGSFPGEPGGESVIRVFPAWPREWDVEFSLLQRGGFMVSSSMKGGVIGAVEVRAERGGIMRMRNPWGTRRISYIKHQASGVDLSSILETISGTGVMEIPMEAGQSVELMKVAD